MQTIQKRLAPVFLAASLAVLTAVPATAFAADGLASELMRRAADLGAAPSSAAASADLEAALLEAYAAQDWRSFWFATDGGGTVGPAGARRLAGALAVLEDAAREGLDPADYQLTVGADEIARFATDADPYRLAALEIEATAALLAYARDAAQGRADPHLRDPNVFAEGPPFEPSQLLAQLADPSIEPGALLLSLSPGHAEYRGLRRALSLYRERAAAPEPPAVPDGPNLKPGMRDPRVAAMRARLAHFGDISLPEAAPDLFTPALAIALQSFQRRHGLEDDAVAGRMTLAALNVSAAERVAQIALNMERWRWLPRALGEEYVLANIAGFTVTMVEGGAIVDRMRAVVGRPYRMSPVFSDQISYIEVNPTWTVPPKIAREDLLPKIQTDPSYLTEGGYQVFSGWGADAERLDPAAIDWASTTPRSFPYKLRQGPGPKNALGQVKIMFPNRFDVYLHDSPARDLFRKASRAFSSGCIRLERPFDLVDWLMRLTGGPDRTAIEAMLESGATTVVKLPRRVPVHLIYATAWAGEDDQVHFRDDVYGRDRLLQAALRGESPPAK